MRTKEDAGSIIDRLERTNLELTRQLVERDRAEEMRAQDSLHEASDEAVRAEFGRRFKPADPYAIWSGVDKPDKPVMYVNQQEWRALNEMLNRPPQPSGDLVDAMAYAMGRRPGNTATMATLAGVDVPDPGNIAGYGTSAKRSRVPAFVREATERQRRSR